jgi:hypothetical protein
MFSFNYAGGAGKGSSVFAGHPRAIIGFDFAAERFSVQKDRFGPDRAEGAFDFAGFAFQ